MNLYCVRHGQSLGNASKQAYYDMPEWKIPLTDLGKEQARDVGYILNDIVIPHIIYSPYVRAEETAAIIGTYSKSLPSWEESVLCREREWGNLREEVESFATREERNHLFDFYRRPTGGESFADVYQRAFIFLNYLKKLDYNNVIIVSHGEFLKVLLMIIDEKTVEEFGSLPNIKNCEIIERSINV